MKQENILPPDISSTASKNTKNEKNNLSAIMLLVIHLKRRVMDTASKYFQ